MGLVRIMAVFHEVGGCRLVHFRSPSNLSFVMPASVVIPALPVMPAKAGIQYSRAAVAETRRRGMLDRPVEPDDDGGI
jgi:hypothetical protein